MYSSLCTPATTHCISFTLMRSTKYIGGHSDLIGGVVSYASKDRGEALTAIQIYLGNNMVIKSQWHVVCIKKMPLKVCAVY